MSLVASSAELPPARARRSCGLLLVTAAPDFSRSEQYGVFGRPGASAIKFEPSFEAASDGADYNDTASYVAACGAHRERVGYPQRNAVSL